MQSEEEPEHEGEEAESEEPEQDEHIWLSLRTQRFVHRLSQIR